jgi:hypothetical protein
MLNVVVLKEARVFVHGKPLQPRLIFVGKASIRAKHPKGAPLG